MRQLNANDICKIILAGKDANCIKIAYNGLTVDYTGKSEPVIYTHIPSTETPTSLDVNSEEKYQTQLNAANEMDTLLFTDPLEYERRIQEADLNAR